MVDMFSFVLPEEQTSFGTYAESVKFIETIEKNGINKVIATPKMNQSTILETEAIWRKVERLNRQLQDIGSEVEVFSGAKIAIFEELSEKKYIDELITLAGHSRYMLLELPNDEVPSYLNELCYQIKLKGITPVLESPEQKRYFQDQPNELYRLVKNGSAVQVNAASVRGRNGNKIKKFSQQLIDSNIVHLITTNTNDDIHLLQDAYREIDKRFGKDHVQYFQNNSQAITQREEITRLLPERMKKRSKLKFW